MTFFDEDALLAGIGREVEALASDALRRHRLPEDQFAFVLLTGPGPGGRPRGAALRPAMGFYPCSLVKVFHLVACQAWLEQGRIIDHPDLDRAMRDMILWSSNTATNYVIDLVTGTTGDTLLGDEEMARWKDRRQAFNRFFLAWNWPELAGLNLDQKLMDDQRYGRERASLGPDGAGHNRLSAGAVARLMYAVFHGDILPGPRAAVVRDHLARDLDSPHRPRAAYQVNGYLAAGLPAGSQVWSKAGRTRWIGDDNANFRRHDTIRAILPAGQEFFLTTMSAGEAINEDDGFLPSVAALVADRLAG
ncbi:beta-lactamase family protein [Stella humosa]|uniref:beta-lactamase n=1 Tax=Stella humosa TaxID=94 RepID=A0A3N1L1Q5_9PROT|nr:serine hydrolase [Stella humosa]ROP84518.1 beta-lactamase family protein [Stella humosa]BBK34038.1 hypothetical protein STHU_46720 [Stella humosa]